MQKSGHGAISCRKGKKKYTYTIGFFHEEALERMKGGEGGDEAKTKK